MTSPIVTAILMTYWPERRANIPKIIESYRKQTVPVEIWLINNSGTEDYGADKLIAIPWNAGEMARYIWCARPETTFVCFQDDDWLITKPDFVQRGLEEVGRRPDYLVGASGVNITWEGSNHYGPEAKKNSGAAILKGHFQIFRRAIAHRVHLMGHFSASDIWWALDISQGAPANYVSKYLFENLKLIDRGGVGLEFRPNHYPERSGVVQQWIQRNYKKPYWWNDGQRKYGLYPEDYIG